MTSSGFTSGTGSTAPEPASAPVPSALLTENAPFPWVLIDSAGRYRCVSPIFVTAFGYTFDDLRTRQDRPRGSPSPTRRSEASGRGAMSAAMKGGHAFYASGAGDRVDRHVLHRSALGDGGRLEIYEDASGLIHHHGALKTVCGGWRMSAEQLLDLIVVLASGWD